MVTPKVMGKKANHYRLTMEEVILKDPNEPLKDPITLEFDNHDDIFKIMDIVKQKQLFESESQAQEFALGLKLFGEVMLKNRNHPIFESFYPAFSAFMKTLKSQ
ncbi:DUF3861 domain-containing protein [Mangrovimonas futianensis]|uniref:DUF3861 domain-containing protein n=1 Tax=Mangrovimonas futianensis TaxID=2895523 RepID=UPI001E319786|nr:DUF3861 domain-containing protein [Mangrovimonas futianensis]MCF1421829.1 DUF3861 domain-containing protein [Mangrovimonas futianensis]